MPKQPKLRKGSHHARREDRMIRNATQHHDFIGKQQPVVQKMHAQPEAKPNARIPRSDVGEKDLLDVALGLIFAPARLALRFVRDVARLPGAILHVLQHQQA
jgi:hypothetical protein